KADARATPSCGFGSRSANGTSTVGILGVIVATVSTMDLIASRAISWPLRTMERNWSWSSCWVLVLALAIVFASCWLLLLTLPSNAWYVKQRCLIYCAAFGAGRVADGFGALLGALLAVAGFGAGLLRAAGLEAVAGFGSAGFGAAGLGAGVATALGALGAT